MFSIFGFTGQSLLNFLDAQHTRKVLSTSTETPFWSGLWSQNKSLMRAVPDDEYEAMLRQRVAKLDMEIAMIDERINEVRRKGEEPKNGK